MVRHKREVFIGSSILIIATLAFLFGWTNLFTVKSVSVSGSPNTQITKQVLLIADIKKGEKLARVEPRSISSKLALAGIDWIENVKISRNWINRNVNIDLSARVAIAKAGERYIDQGGVLFTSPVQVNEALVEIEAKDDAARAAAVELFLALPSELRNKIVTLSASTSNNFQFVLNDDLKINWGGNSNTEVKVKIYKALIELPENKKINQMDVSDPTKPTVK
jgi:cell division septal protein FtsQ